MTTRKVHNPQRDRYGDSVPIGRRHERHAPTRFVEDKARFEGMWIASVDDEVVAVAETSRALVWKLRELGPKADAAVVEFVRPATDGYIVGVG